MNIVFDNWLEIFGVVSSLIYIWLEIKQRSSLWIVGFISSGVYAVVFLRHGLYAFSTLYAYYVLASVYGMYCWRFSQKESMSELPISRLTLRTGLVLTFISIALFVVIGYVLDNYTDSTAVPPYSEALATALSMVATWMLARKILEHWLLWIFVNFFSSCLYFWCGLYLTGGLFVVYGVLSVVGWVRWKGSVVKGKG